MMEVMYTFNIFSSLVNIITTLHLRNSHFNTRQQSLETLY